MRFLASLYRLFISVTAVIILASAAAGAMFTYSSNPFEAVGIVIAGFLGVAGLGAIAVLYVIADRLDEQVRLTEQLVANSHPRQSMPNPGRNVERIEPTIRRPTPDDRENGR